MRKTILICTAALMFMALPLLAEPGQSVPGRLLVMLARGPSDRIDEYFDGKCSFEAVFNGDPAIPRMFQEYRVEGMERLFDDVALAVKNRGSMTVREAYLRHVQKINMRFPQRFARAPGGAVHVDTYGLFVIRFDKAVPPGVFKAALEATPHVLWAEPDKIVNLSVTLVNDPDFSQLWGITKIGCPNAWDTAQGSGIVVAVVDTGVQLNHTDLAANIWVNTVEQGGVAGTDDDNNGFIDDLNGWDFVSNDNNPTDGGNHGTHCAGTIAAVGNNNTGVVGVSFLSKIMACRGLGTSGGTDTWLSGGMNYASANGADVISNSWGGVGYSSTYDTVITNCVAAGVVPVFAAGNGDSSGVGIDGTIFEPCNCPQAFSVAASNQTDGRAGFSNHCIKIDVTAPGVAIRSTIPTNTYASFQGTSMATPHVSGALAAMLSDMLARSQTLSVEQARQVLRKGADDIEVAGWGRREGHGRLNLNNMMGATPSSVCEAKITSPYAKDPVEGSSVLISGYAWAPSGFNGYVLEYAPGTPRDSDSGWTQITSSSSTVQNNTLATWDATSVTDGRYTVRLTALNSANQPFRDRIELVLDRHSDDTYQNAVEVKGNPLTHQVFLDRNLGANDQDWFKFEAVSGVAYEFRTSRLTGMTDTVLTLFQSNGTTQIASVDDYPAGGDKVSRIAWTCGSSGTYYIKANGWFDTSTYPNPDKGSYRLTLKGLFKDGYEDDSASTSAAALAVNGRAQHRSIVPANDVDWFSAACEAGRTYTFEVSKASQSASMTLELYGTDGTTLLQTGSAGTDGRTRVAAWTCPSSGTYLLRATCGTAGHYLARVFEKQDVLYSENFEIVGADIWTAVNGSWAVVSGGYREQTDNTTAYFSRAGIATWKDTVVEGTLRLQTPMTSTNANAGLVVVYENADNFIVCRIRRDDVAEIVQHENGVQDVLASVPRTFNDDTDYPVRITFEDRNIVFDVAGTVVASSYSMRFHDGQIALRSFGGHDAFDNLKVWRPAAGSISDLTLTTTVLRPGMANAAYSAATLAASGGTAPYTFSALGGLPPGMTLAADGTVSGTPTAAGTYTIRVRLDDSGERLLAGLVTLVIVPQPPSDTTPPAVTFVAPTDLLELGAQPGTLSVDVTDVSEVKSVECRVGSGSFAPMTWTGSARWTASITLAEGFNTIEVRAEDYSANLGVSSITVDLDTTPPEISLGDWTDGEASFVPAITINGVALDAVTLTINGAPAANFSTVSGDWSQDVTLVHGPNVFTVVATDSLSRTTTVVFTVHHRLKGDVDDDGDVDEDDALLVLRFESGELTPTSVDIAVGDVDQNGILDANDAYAIRKAAAGLLTFN